MVRIFILFTFLVILSSQIICQDKAYRLINQRFSGMLVEYGQPYYDLRYGGRYYIGLLGGSYEFPLFRAKKKFNVSMQIFPNIGYVLIFDGRNDFEFGLNVRLGLNFQLSDKDVLSGKIGSGPHYITYEAYRQTKGFIFSDYFLGTYKRSIGSSKDKFVMEIELGYRHISNAGLKLPNGSLSDFIVGFGFYKLF